MKKKINVLIISLLMVGVVGCASAPLESKKDVFVVEYGEPLKTTASTYVRADKDVLKNTKIKIKKATNEKEKDYVPVGTYTAQAEYKKDVVKFKIAVKDTVKPTFVNFTKEIKVEQNAQVDFTTFYKAVDKIGETEAAASIGVDSKKVDLSVIGTYEMKVTARDTQKNKTTKVVKVTVVSSEEAMAGNVSSSLDGNKAISETTKQQQVTAQEQTPPPAPNTGGGGGNTGGSNNGNTGGGGTPTPPTPPTIPDGGSGGGTYCGWMDEGIPSEIFGTQMEVGAWAAAQGRDENGPHFSKRFRLTNAGCMPDGSGRFGIQWL